MIILTPWSKTLNGAPEWRWLTVILFLILNKLFAVFEHITAMCRSTVLSPTSFYGHNELWIKMMSICIWLILCDLFITRAHGQSVGARNLSGLKGIKYLLHSMTCQSIHNVYGAFCLGFWLMFCLSQLKWNYNKKLKLFTFCKWACLQIYQGIKKSLEVFILPVL